MRLWSIHPSYLDRQGLLAVWREGLLAKKVLEGETKGYKNHPQLIRFREHEEPLNAINYYLSEILKEGETRSYRFDHTKLYPVQDVSGIFITGGQITYEFSHLLLKLKARDHQRFELLKQETKIKIHPLFIRVEGGIAPWEIKESDQETTRTEIIQRWTRNLFYRNNKSPWDLIIMVNHFDKALS